MVLFFKGRNSISLKLLLALNNWESWRKGELLNHLEIKNIYEYLGSNVLEGFRKGKTLHSDDKYTLKECKKDHGLLQTMFGTKHLKDSILSQRITFVI